ncbi:hypothetical protein T12_1064 [Trichinella patagoniensis]|uniref:PiggyBac transposable element-derived protein domain-containing protein n=1 Tax=Trichinella patagoniensis TaxID=990121 RepID=A0A0V0Z6R5_9BILA|nr:hypothetical protein T12_1064 [Trichinella patagoniensis]
MTVVTRMVSPWSAKAHNIMTDNFFRSVGLVEKLIAQNVSIVGTSQETTKATSHQKMAVIIESQKGLSGRRQQTEHEICYRQTGTAVLLQAVESSMARGITSFQYARCCRSGCGYKIWTSNYSEWNAKRSYYNRRIIKEVSVEIRICSGLKSGIYTL